ncbi:unnamed protein product [Mortierella alpina]
MPGHIGVAASMYLPRPLSSPRHRRNRKTWCNVDARAPLCVRLLRTTRPKALSLPSASNDSDLSMAVDILSYDQIPEDGLPAVDSEALVEKAAQVAESEPKTSVEEATAQLSPTSNSQSDNDAPKADSASPPASVKLAGENWSSDPSAYLTNNVVDLSRNVLICIHASPRILPHRRRRPLRSTPTVARLFRPGRPRYHSHPHRHL